MRALWRSSMLSASAPVPASSSTVSLRRLSLSRRRKAVLGVAIRMDAAPRREGIIV